MAGVNSDQIADRAIVPKVRFVSNVLRSGLRWRHYPLNLGKEHPPGQEGPLLFASAYVFAV